MGWLGGEGREEGGKSTSVVFCVEVGVHCWEWVGFCWRVFWCFGGGFGGRWIGRFYGGPDFLIFSGGLVAIALWLARSLQFWVLF